MIRRFCRILCSKRAEQLVTNLDQLETWFPSGTAEGERAIIERVFVYVSELKRVLAPKPGNPLLLVGRKGTGKSAIIDFAVKLLELECVPALVLQPTDIPTSDLSDADSMGDVKRKFREILLSSIAAKLSENRKGLLTGDQATLYNEAIRSGKRSPDLIGRIARSLAGVAKPIVKADFSAAFPTLTPGVTLEIQSAVSKRLVDKHLYIFIDDTDQVANPEKPGHLNRIWGLLLAVRDLSSQIPEICAIITLREEVWQRLKRETGSQRDQTDHFANLVIQVSSSDQHVQNIVEVRLRAAAALCSPNEGEYGTFFEGPGAKAPQSPDFRSWQDLILVRSRQRPRDAIQLIATLANYAMHTRHVSKIDQETFQAVMPIFSEERANLFAQEVEGEFPSAIDVLRSFADADYGEGGFRLTADETKSHISKLSSQFSISVYGEVVRPERVDDVFNIWRFLYITGILNARISDDRERDGFRHLMASDDPLLVTKARWNEMQGYLWEINPAFRDYLISRQADRKARTGLPTRKARTTVRKGRNKR